MIIQFKYKGCGLQSPFFSSCYVATLIKGQVVLDSEETYLDYISPIASVIDDFKLVNKYEYQYKDYLKARQAVVERRDFVLPLVFIGRERP